MKKIIFVNRYFYPDHSATSQLLSDLASSLKISNFDVHIITSRMMYDDESVVLSGFENWNGINIHRCWTSRFGRSGLTGRAVDYLTFYISSFYVLLFIVSKNDIVVAKTDPPLISVLCAIVVKLKGAFLINWLQDLFPEIAKELGVNVFPGVIYRAVKHLRNWSLNMASYNVVLGDLMKEKIKSETNSKSKIELIPNWVVGKEVHPVLKKENNLRNEWGIDDKFVIGYSGNLGRAHDYKTILESVIQLKDYKKIKFVFIGGGEGYDILKCEAEKLKLSNILFKPYQPLSLLAQSLSVADVHIISLAPSLEGLIVPSKFYGILSVGRPIIFIGDSNGEIARKLTEYSCGENVSVGNNKLLENIILGFQMEQRKLDEYSKSSRLLFEKKYAVGFSISRWQTIITSIINI